MTRLRRTLVGLAVAAATTLALAPSASAAEATCAGTFDVLHNDRIGSMQVPRGPYVVTVLDSTTMGCTEASRLFSEFLEDWDGRLPRPWVADNATRTFRPAEGAASASASLRARARARRTARPALAANLPGLFLGAAQRPDRRASGSRRAATASRCCPTAASAARVGAPPPAVPAGLRRRASAALAPGSGHRHVHARTSPRRLPHQAVCPETSPPVQAPGGPGRQPGSTPERRPIEVPCDVPGPHNDRIGALRLKKGNYNVWVKGLSCPRSTQLFAQFLQDVNGVLPRPWVLDAQTGTFRRGNVLFRVKPVRP